MPRASDIQMCSIYESISLALQSINGIFLYEYKNTSQGSIFRKLQTIKSHNLNNFVCFESGYLQFLAISGPEAALFHFEDDEFKFNVESEAGFGESVHFQKLYFSYYSLMFHFNLLQTSPISPG